MEICLVYNIAQRDFVFAEETADVSRSAKRSKQMQGTLIIKDGVRNICVIV
jgi:hypothetical protein